MTVTLLAVACLEPLENGSFLSFLFSHPSPLLPRILYYMKMSLLSRTVVIVVLASTAFLALRSMSLSQR